MTGERGVPVNQDRHAAAGIEPGRAGLTGIRSGGEKRPLDYPHLYQIQAGDWRISYAVEHNRLAILVLEVLQSDGASSKDPAQDNLTKKIIEEYNKGAGKSTSAPAKGKK